MISGQSDEDIGQGESTGAAGHGSSTVRSVATLVSGRRTLQHSQQHLIKCSSTIYTQKNISNMQITLKAHLVVVKIDEEKKICFGLVLFC